jgi:hypothetical protein
MMLRLVPNIFYEKLSDGLDLFVTCLGFSVLYQDDELAVVRRDGAKVYLVESAEFAAKDRPQIAIETDTIEDLFGGSVQTYAAHSSPQVRSDRVETLGLPRIRRTGQDRCLCRFPPARALMPIGNRADLRIISQDLC